jgi:type 1 glutamine amidotransferase
MSGLALAAALLLSTPCAQAQTQPVKKVLFLTKSSGFQHSVVTRKGEQPGWAEVKLKEFGAKHGYEVTFTKDGSLVTKDGLAGFDVIMLYTTGDLTKASKDGGAAMTPEGKQALLDFIESGKGVVGLHTATDTFNTGRDVDPYTRVIGGQFAGHDAQQKATQKVIAKDFPGLQPLGDAFELMDEWYAMKNVAKDMQVVLLQQTEGMKGKNYEGKPPYPSAWIRAQGKGRVFYTSMGHREDVITNPVFETVVLAGLDWAAGRTKYEVKPDVEKVAPGIAFAPDKKP